MGARRLNARRAAPAVLLAAATAVAVVTMSGDEGHRVFVTVPDAVNVIAGQQVRVDGRARGEVESLEAIRGGRAARIALRIDDEAWPLTRGTRMSLRWGGTIAFNDRYIELRRGRTGAPDIPDGATLPARAFRVPVEFDQLLSTFTPGVRRDAKAMIDHAGTAFRKAERPLRRSLDSAPAAVFETSAVLEDLEAESDALGTLVRSGDRLVNAIDRADPGVGRLVSGAATTFAATGRKSAAMRAALRAAPTTLARTRVTLGRADATLEATGELTDRLAPGVEQMRRIAPPLTGLLRSLRRVGPEARTTLATTRRATPQINPFLARSTELMPRIGSIGRQSAEQLPCVRPYVPDAAGFLATWGDWLSNSDGKDRYGRFAVQAPPFSNAETNNSAEAAALNPELTYAHPRPPGWGAAQPWLQPECGIGPDVFDPAKDPETRP